ncbi:MAG: ARMT1-like domain-containing protein [candidate division WOR-3 bacterium]
MHSSPDCLNCAVNQCRKIVRLVGGDQALEQRVIETLLPGFAHLDQSEPPSTYTSHILLAAMELLDERDPFRAVKQQQNDSARPIAEALDRELGDGPSALVTALALAAAGNVIDSGPGHKYTIEGALSHLHFAHDDSALLLDRLTRAARVMYVLDNAGEVLFDLLVLKRLRVPELTIVARSSPILNDVTVDEARALGFDRYGRLIGTGSPFLGVDFRTVSAEFRAAYEHADTVIAKGHANFESLVSGPRDGFFLLKAKCDLVARELGIKTGDSACFYSPGIGKQRPRQPTATALVSETPCSLDS